MIEIDNILDVEKHLSGIEAVIFDLDDTLYSEKEYVRSGYKAVAEFLKMPCIADEMRQSFEDGGRPIDDVLDKHGLMDKKDEALFTYRSHKPCIHLYPGVKEMLERLEKIKKLGIITDGRPEGQRAKIDVLGIDELIDKIIITDELGGIEFRKPNGTAFTRMKEYFGFDYSRMAYVGDNINKDFIAPLRLGMQVVYFRNPDGLYVGEAR